MQEIFMNITEKLDLAIKLSETGTTDGAYAIPYKGNVLHKTSYLSNDEWKAFLEAMPAEARRQYGQGGGDELSEKDGHPPKMASYGSSSRLIYNLSRETAGFAYEKKLPTTVGGNANLDGFYETDTRYVFVEAKCHEPYTAKRNTVSAQYADLYAYINEQMQGSIRIDMTPSTCGRYLNADYFADGEKLERFDMKQMICHLLGIATGVLKGTLEQKQTDFIYLLYDPTELDIEPVAKAQIDRIYERVCYECNLVDFAELFRVILGFLMERKYQGVLSDDDVEDLILKFTFILASQELYPLLLQSFEKEIII
jgi:hypothetical protein